MVAVTDRSTRIGESKSKICKPFELDESLCLYSPQDNVDSLSNPRVEEWLDFIKNVYVPELPKSKRAVLLLLPCTKTKPYIFSTEHKRINQRLIEEGFRPVDQGVGLSEEIRSRLEEEFDPRVLSLGPLVHPNGTAIHRVVISEPLALVPYEQMIAFRGRQAPSVSYDDPGLFENRGNAVSPWRDDSTAIQVSRSRWRWGDQERLSYVHMHNVMAEIIAEVISRLGEFYTHRIAWVAPGLTHRSFVLGAEERGRHKVPRSKLAFGARQELIGANDLLHKTCSITALPLRDQCDLARQQLAARLNVDTRSAQSYYATGGGGATPLALPELLNILVAEIFYGHQ